MKLLPVLLLAALVAPAFTLARLVTIGGPATEIVFALGAGDAVVAVDQSSVHPPAVHRLPKIGYVRTISAEGVLALEPSKIVATSDIGPPLAVEQLQASDVPMLIVDAPKSPEALIEAIRETGEFLDRQEEAENLIKNVRADLAKVATLAEAPRVIFFMQTPNTDGLVAAGKRTKADAMIEFAGGENAVTAHSGYKPLSAEALLALRPDVILVGIPEGPMGNPAHAEAAINTPLWQRLPAVKSGDVHVVPLGKTLGFGPRLGEAAAQLNEYFAEAH